MNKIHKALYLIIYFFAILPLEIHADLPPDFLQGVSLDSYALPEDDPIQSKLKAIFKDPKMFKSGRHLCEAGFDVIRGGKKLMVGAHPKVKNFLFKKYPNSKLQSSQLENFIKRILGAEILRNFIAQHNFKHLVVPKKWLYKLPEKFSNGENTPAYILIAEKMDIYDDWDDPDSQARMLYYNMSQEMLTELCIVLHAVGGCDGYPRNQPFTRSGKIAFIDTEHVGMLKDHFIKHIVPALNEELQVFAWNLWMELEEVIP